VVVPPGLSPPWPPPHPPGWAAGSPRSRSPRGS
jgi:hypothetical protein